MITYQINITDKNKEAFLNLLKNANLVETIKEISPLEQEKYFWNFASANYLEEAYGDNEPDYSQIPNV